MNTQKIIYALGFFDGVHLGHQALLSACKDLARRYGHCSGVCTFASHPDTLVSGKTPALINTPEDRKQLLCAFGAEKLLVLPFDSALRAMPWQEFVTLLLQAYNAGGFVVGEDFRFGYRGEGTAQELARLCSRQGLPCAVVPAQTLNGTVVSSTYIRTLLSQGNMEEAVRFLGHPHVLTGEVLPGKQLGRTIGIPTANLALPEGLAVPKFGVYACRCTANGVSYAAVTNIGTRPTVDGCGITVEAWLLDFDGDLYGQRLTLEFYKFLRPEKKFSNLQALQKQIQTDEKLVREKIVL